MPNKLFSIILAIIAGISQYAYCAESLREIVATSIARDKTSVCALRDHYGFLWVGTMSGLACYDGNGNSVYHNSYNILRSTEGYNITSLFETDDNIWFGANSGLFIFDRNSNTVIPFPYTTKYKVSVSSPVQRMMQVDESHIWIITHGQGIFVLNLSDNSLNQNSRYGSFYSDVTVSNSGQVYAMTHDGRLQSFSNEGAFLSEQHLPDFITDKNPIKMAADNGYIWISTHSGLYQYDLVQKQLNRNLLPLSLGSVNAILIPEGHNNLLLGADNGLWEFNIPTGEYSRVQFDNSSLHGGFADTRMVDLSSDSDGSVILVSPSSISFMLHRPSTFLHKVIDPSISSRNLASAMTTASDGSVWIGTEQGLRHYNPSSGDLIPAALAGGPYAIKAITEIGDNLWIGTVHQGLVVYNPSTGETKRYRYDENSPYAIASNEVNSVFHTSENEIFVLTSWGLCRYNPISDNFPPVTELGSHTSFTSIAQDGKGRLWTATADNKIYMRKDIADIFHLFSSKTLGNRGVNNLFYDNNGRLWATSQNGRVYLFDEDENDFTPLDISMSREHPVSFINEDPAGNIWVGTAEMVVKINSKLQPSHHTYRPNANVLPVMNSTCRLPDGRILFGDDNAVWSFSPGKVTDSDHSPATYIQSLSFPYFDDSDRELDRLGLNVLLYTRDVVEIPYSYNTFTLHMAAKRFGDLPSVMFDYKLEGVDKDWVHGADGEATYTALPPGKYNFMVRPDSGSDSDISSLAIVILPPWYRSWWAWLIYALTVMAAAYGVFLLSRRKIRQRTQLRVNAMRREKEREAYETKVRFFVNLVHEIRTPLTLINLPLEQLAENARNGVSSPESTSRHINSMQRNVNYLLGITNQLLDFRKAEQESEIRLVTRRINVSDLLRHICERFDHPLYATGKELVTDIPDGILATVDPEKLDRVIMNIIGNAMKYSREKVRVSLRHDEDTFTITVDDDGNGIPLNETEKIFDTYYQIGGDNVAANLGTGLGLAYAKLIVDTHGGEIAATNNEMGGASFSMTIPANNESTAPAAKPGDILDEDQSIAKESDTTKRLTILLVDDNPELLESVGDSLADLHTVVKATDASKALELLKDREDIDLVISDFMMPGMDGGEFCRKVKNNPDTSYLPFIMLTAKTGDEARGDAFESGADIYVEKPFSIRQLKRQISNIFATRERFYSRMSQSNILSANTVAESPFLNPIDTQFIATLNSHLQANVEDENFAIDATAQMMNMSRSTFYRKIKALTGMTPNEYLKNYRLDYSTNLLKSGVRVSDVAAMSGFSSSSYFSKCFKIKFGKLPKQYSEDFQKKQESP